MISFLRCREWSRGEQNREAENSNFDQTMKSIRLLFNFCCKLIIFLLFFVLLFLVICLYFQPVFFASKININEIMILNE